MVATNRRRAGEPDLPTASCTRWCRGWESNPEGPEARGILRPREEGSEQRTYSIRCLFPCPRSRRSVVESEDYGHPHGHLIPPAIGLQAAENSRDLESLGADCGGVRPAAELPLALRRWWMQRYPEFGKCAGGGPRGRLLPRARRRGATPSCEWRG